MSTRTITLPQQVIVKVLRASAAFEAVYDELEDYLIGNQPALVSKLRRARREHLAGKTRPFIFPPLYRKTGCQKTPVAQRAS